jgi:hypothetical protein
MPFPESSPNYQLNNVEQLIGLADTALQTMEPAVISRLRSSTHQFIMLHYGKEHHFNASYKRIDQIDSQYYLNRIKGVLMAIKDDILFQQNMRNSSNGSTSGKDDVLTGKLLSHFMQCTI